LLDLPVAAVSITDKTERNVATYQVSSQDELYEALAKASGGDVIEVASGDYGEFFLLDTSYSSAVTITAADPSDPPVFASVQLWEVDNLTFDNVVVDFEPDVDTVEWTSAVRIDGSSEITFSNSTINGGDAVAGIPADSEAGTQGANGIMGYPIGYGFGVYSSDGIVIENCDISEFGTGFRGSNIDGLEIIASEFSDIRTVPIAGADFNDVLIDGNYLSEVTPWSFSSAGDHGDFIHIYTVEGQTEPSDNIVITNNYMVQGEGVSVLGIYLDDNLNDAGYTNVVIDNNVIVNGNAQGITVENADGITITNNTLISSSVEGDDVPTVLLYDT